MKATQNRLCFLCAVAPAIAFGATARAVDGVIEVALSGFRQPYAFYRALPFSAITLGHVVLATSQAELDRLRAHEQAHVRQYEVWGVFFLLAYPAASLWQMLRGRRAHLDNWFEVQARKAASNASRVAQHRQIKVKTKEPPM